MNCRVIKAGGEQSIREIAKGTIRQHVELISYTMDLRDAEGLRQQCMGMSELARSLGLIDRREQEELDGYGHAAYEQRSRENRVR